MLVTIFLAWRLSYCNHHFEGFLDSLAREDSILSSTRVSLCTNPIQSNVSFQFEEFELKSSMSKEWSLCIIFYYPSGVRGKVKLKISFNSMKPFWEAKVWIKMVVNQGISCISTFDFIILHIKTSLVADDSPVNHLKWNFF